ncbi:MAG TPA: hypothetical protein VNN77_15415 [candidate division Zixibacteria bacterium]|nr:hypothetical protein [candidate division Zixibacteria bacterium]
MPKPASSRLARRETIDSAEWGIPESPEFSAIERLMTEFQAHELHEEKFIQIYREAARSSANPLIKFLLRLILADEERHQAVNRMIISMLKSDSALRNRLAAQPPEVAEGFYELGGEGEKLLKTTEDFIRLEQEAIRQCQHLLSTSRRYHHGLFSMLCNAMIRDSRKHVEILRFLHARLRKAFVSKPR